MNMLIFCFGSNELHKSHTVITIIQTLEKLRVTPRFGLFGSGFLLLENPQLFRTFDRKLRRDFDGEHLQRSTAALGEDAGCGASPLRPDLPLH